MARSEMDGGVWQEQIPKLVEQLGTSLVDGLLRGMGQSNLVKRLSEVLGQLHERIEALEHGQEGALVERLVRLEKEVTELRSAMSRADELAEPAPPPRAPIAPPKPPANKPQDPTVSNLPFGLSAAPVPATRSSKRTPNRRVRNTVRPTVVYRTDPRANRSAHKQEADGEGAAAKPSQATCSEAGCHLPAESSGMCSLHQDRAAARKRTASQTSLDPFPMPPLPQRRSDSGRKKESGTKGVFAVLYEEKGRRTLAGLINQMKFDRSDVVERLNKQFEGLPGVPLDDEDVLRVVHYHKLGEAIHKREGEIVCRHIRKQRGSMVKAAQKMKIEVERLKSRIEDLDMVDQVAQIRNEFREEILEKTSFSARLDLALTREKYLKDLGIESDLDASMRDEIRAQLEGLSADLPQGEAEGAICQALGLDEQRFRRMVRRYELEAEMTALGVDLSEEGES